MKKIAILLSAALMMVLAAKPAAAQNEYPDNVKDVAVAYAKAFFSGDKAVLEEMQAHYREKGKPAGLRLGANIRFINEKTMEFVRTEPDRSMVDGVACSSLIFLGDPDRHGSREMLLYWDREIPQPDLKPGRIYSVKYTGKNIFTVQFHPDACPGPQDSGYLFDRFIRMMSENKRGN